MRLNATESLNGKFVLGPSFLFPVCGVVGKRIAAFALDRAESMALLTYDNIANTDKLINWTSRMAQIAPCSYPYFIETKACEIQ